VLPPGRAGPAEDGLTASSRERTSMAESFDSTTTVPDSMVLMLDSMAESSNSAATNSDLTATQAELPPSGAGAGHNACTHGERERRRPGSPVGLLPPDAGAGRGRGRDRGLV
jgi:hypothetical protein